MKTILDVLRTPSGRALLLWRAVGTRMGATLGAAMALFAALVMLATAATPPAWAQAQPNAEFDHLQTGFPLTERHAKARCESCHQNAIFKGTPRDCASCHREGMRLARGNVVSQSFSRVRTSLSVSMQNQNSSWR